MQEKGTGGRRRENTTCCIFPGDILRGRLSSNKTWLGSQKYMDAGQLVPDEVVIGIVAPLNAARLPNGFLFDGFRGHCRRQKRWRRRWKFRWP
ncbi:MAG: nucleoside monophosphate kinase [Christensenellales bacterium]